MYEPRMMKAGCAMLTMSRMPNEIETPSVTAAYNPPSRMPAISALITRSKLRSNSSPHGSASPAVVIPAERPRRNPSSESRNPVTTKHVCLPALSNRRARVYWSPLSGSPKICERIFGAPLAGTTMRSLRRLLAHVLRQRQRLVGALEKLHGHENHLLVAEVFQIVDLELPGPIGFVASLAGRVGIFDRRAVVHVLAPAAAAHCSPEVVEHVAMETDALARLQADHPDARAIALRQQHAADAWVGRVLLPLEFRGDLRRPSRALRALRLLVQHRQCHGNSSGVPPDI